MSLYKIYRDNNQEHILYSRIKLKTELHRILTVVVLILHHCPGLLLKGSWLTLKTAGSPEPISHTDLIGQLAF